MTSCDFLLECTLSELYALEDDARDRVTFARGKQETQKALSWQRCIFWAQFIVRDGALEYTARAFNRARKAFLSL